jgi:hypothetical protein
LRSQSDLSPCSVPPRSAVRDLTIICYYFRLSGYVKRTACYALSFTILPSPSSPSQLSSPSTSSLVPRRRHPTIVLVRLAVTEALLSLSNFPNARPPLLWSAGPTGKRERERDSRSPTSLSNNDDLDPPCQRPRATGTQRYVFFHPLSFR